MIYMDSAATTKVLPEAAAAALELMTQAFYNPSAIYQGGLAVHHRMDGFRETVASALHARADQLVFTASGSEGASLAIYSALHVNRHKKGRHIVTTAIEHAAVREPLLELERRVEDPYEITWLQPDREGEITAQAVAEAIRADTILVSIMAVNNELGTVMPLEAVGPAIKRVGSPALFHTDAVQAFMKIPFDPVKLGADYANVSGHKIGAPKGIGALFCREPKKLIKPMILGGGQEHGARSGTENVPGMAAFAKAVELRQSGFEKAVDHMCSLRDEILRRAEAMEGVAVLAHGKAPHIAALSLVGYPGETTVRYFGSEFDICISKGSACHKGKPSHVFAALRRSPEETKGALRISLCPENTMEEIDQLFAALCAAKALAR